MPTIHEIFNLEDEMEIRWATQEPNWIEKYQTDGLEDVWERIPPEWLCTIMSIHDGGPFFTHFCGDSHLNILHPYGVLSNGENLHALAAAIAKLRCFQYSGYLFSHNLQGPRLGCLNAAAIAAYKASSDLRASFPLLEQYCTQSLPKGGYIYLLSDQVGHYKIGHTVDVKRRLAELRTQPPFDIVTLAYAYVPDRFLAEKELHQLHSKYRLRGEWFSLPDDVVAKLQRGLAHVHASSLHEIAAYASFNLRDWRMVDDLCRDWMHPDRPSFLERSRQEKEEGIPHE